MTRNAHTIHADTAALARDAERQARVSASMEIHNAAEWRALADALAAAATEAWRLTNTCGYNPNA